MPILNVLTSLVMPDRNVVKVQMGSRLVHVQDSVKNVKIWVAILETLHVLFQAISHKLFIFRSDARILTLSDLHHHFVKTLLVESIDLDRVAGLTAEKVFIVVTDLAIISFLTGIISLGRFLEKLVVCFAIGCCTKITLFGVRRGSTFAAMNSLLL